MQIKTKKRIAMWLCIPAAVFLCNPTVAFVDILPDCIGCLLFCLGLAQVADLSDRLADSLKLFRIMLIVSTVVFILQSKFGFGKIETEEAAQIYEQPVIILLLSFLQFVVYCILLIPAFRNLFLGLGYLAEHSGGEGILCVRRNRTLYERLADRCTVFVPLMSGLALLPEFSVLTSFEYMVEKVNFDWYKFIWLFRVLATMAMTVIGLIWLISIIRFFKRALCDKLWMAYLENRYAEEILVDFSLHGMRKYRFAFGFLMLASVCFVHLRVDGMNLFPAWAASLGVIAGVLLLGEIGTRRRWLFLSCGALAVVSVLQTVLTQKYIEDYVSADASLYFTEAYRAFLVLRIVQILQTLLCFVCIMFLLKLLMSLVREKLRESFEGDDEASQRATKRLHRSFFKRGIVVMIFFILSMLSTVVEIWLQANYPMLWWIPFLLSIVSILALCSFLFAFLEEIKMQFLAARAHK